MLQVVFVTLDSLKERRTQKNAHSKTIKYHNQRNSEECCQNEVCHKPVFFGFNLTYSATAEIAIVITTIATIQPIVQNKSDFVKISSIFGRSPGFARKIQIKTAVNSRIFGDFSIKESRIDFFTAKRILRFKCSFARHFFVFKTSSIIPSQFVQPRIRLITSYGAVFARRVFAFGS